MKLLNVRGIFTILTVAAAVYAVRSGRPTGRILNIPYDFRFPTTDRIQERFWNEKDDRIFTPLVFGAGWGLNLYQLLRKFQADNEVEEEEISAADFEL